MDLFDEDDTVSMRQEKPEEGVVLLRQFARANGTAMLQDIHQITEKSPFRHMLTPGGYTMSVSTSSCGTIGWISDRKGYRYSPYDPETGDNWPVMPSSWCLLAHQAADLAGFLDFVPDTCLINRYAPGNQLSLHQDKDEEDFNAPIVSVSLGLPATFLLGGMTRSSRVQRLLLTHDDVLVFGGPSRLRHHGIAPVRTGHHPATGPYRINLTFRRALG